MNIISIALFILPFISAIFLFANSQGMTVLYGLLLIVATIIFLTVSSSLEKILTKKVSSKTLSYLMTIYYFSLVIISITLSWKFINSIAIGKFWVFLFAFSCCYIPYNYMLQKEQAKSGKIGMLTNITNSYSVLGYLLFGILMNFTNINIYWSYSLLVFLGLIFIGNYLYHIRNTN